MFPLLTRQVFPPQTRALGIGFCAGISKLGSLICPFVSEVCRYPNVLVDITSRIETTENNAHNQIN